jgi:hypothetical protein
VRTSPGAVSGSIEARKYWYAAANRTFHLIAMSDFAPTDADAT